ncbi:BBP7 family outer membrane beta-barrel protein [Mariniblastus fucicola]|uniref:Uncharacterized protein n=1 Tax=Mariniblastus fucicola TaxID=980251 RepID=A0A5B9P2H7_9BACT|nr:BBP7 family outer membrane beta-barrel protein [Mariniblastus fucicola]QEG20548.1 hypothetical protein MFFC18_03970 [Mariniblastus fucicola]
MKRMWQNWLAIVTLVTMVGTANAQHGWNQPSEIGSYQSILSRAGYGNNMGSLGQGMMQPGVPMQGSAMEGGAMVQGSTAMYGMNGVQSGAVNGGATMMSAPTGAVHGSVLQGGSMGGVVGSAATAGQVMSTPMAGAVPMQSAMPMQSMAPMATAAPMISAPAMGGMVNTGTSFVGSTPMASPSMCNSSLFAGSAGSACAAPVYSTPIYQQAVMAPTYVAAPQRPRANYTIGLTGMYFQRDYEDNRFLAQNPSGDTLYTNDADEQTFDGFGVTLASRNASGSGMEVGYWALNPGRSAAILTGANVATNIQGLDQLIHVSSGRDLYDIYANTVAQTIVRETDINNLEFNVLRNGGTFCGRNNRKGFYELLGGFRWFEFNESLQYTSSIDNVAYPLVPSDFFYNLEARNRLLGFQLGARNEYCLGSKLRLFSGVKGGVFNNNIRTMQNITDLNGEIAQVNGGPSAGRPFSYNDEKNDVAFLGELDFGVLYHLSCRTRIRLGYRAIGVSGVALAADQMPYDYTDPNELLSANSNGSLMLGGGYYGLEFCF